MVRLIENVPTLKQSLNGFRGIYTPAAHFTDLGYTLTPDSMVSFQRAVLPLVVGSFLIIIGNTGFPCMLRFSIWLCQIVVRRSSPLWEELRFLLAHPRRCFTLLFPSEATWWLFWVLVILTGLDVMLYVVLDVSSNGKSFSFELETHHQVA